MELPSAYLIRTYRLSVLYPIHAQNSQGMHAMYPDQNVVLNPNSTFPPNMTQSMYVPSFSGNEMKKRQC